MKIRDNEFSFYSNNLLYWIPFSALSWSCCGMNAFFAASLKHRKDADMFCLSFKWFVIFYILLLYSAPGYKVDTFFIVEVGSGNWTDFDLFHQIDFETWSKHIDKRLLLTFKHGTRSERSPLTLRTLIKIFEWIKSKSLQYKTNRSRHRRNLCWL